MCEICLKNIYGMLKQKKAKKKNKYFSELYFFYKYHINDRHQFKKSESKEKKTIFFKDTCLTFLIFIWFFEYIIQITCVTPQHTYV